MRFILLLMMTYFLSACATTAKYEAVLQTWVGQPEDNLVSKWGPPASTYPLSGGKGKMLTYQQGAGSISTNLGYGIYSTENYSCKTTFTVDGSGVIQNWRWEGNSCKAK